MKEKPTGCVAVCQCGNAVGAIDYARTEKKEAGKILSKWIADGCVIEPRFSGTWSVMVNGCGCE